MMTHRIVMAGLGPAIHVFFDIVAFKTWMPATSAGMTVQEAMRRIYKLAGWRS